MAKDLPEALRYALADAYEIGHGGGHCAAGRAEARMLCHDGESAEFEAWVVEFDGKRPPQESELPAGMWILSEYEPYGGAGYRIARVRSVF